MKLKIHQFIYTVIYLFVISACSAPKKVQNATTKTADMPVVQKEDLTKTSMFLQDLLNKYPAQMQSILQHKDSNNVQIIYTTIDRGKNGLANFKNYYYNVNEAHYFYPASTVKFPIIILALQRLNELKLHGIDKNTTLLTEAGTAMQTAVYNDPTSADGRPTIAHYIKKILLYSDNDAFNRLYEFLGQEYINAELHKRGYADVQIVHRLSVSLPEEENRKTNPFKFLDAANNILYQQPLQTSKLSYASRNDSLGYAYMQGNGLVPKPMDFSKKNRISLEDLHSIMQSIIFPESAAAKKRFNITEDDRQFLLKYMSQLPMETTFPPSPVTASDSLYPFSKPYFFSAPQPIDLKNIRVFNKTGGAYGQLLDVAYVVDFDKNVEFFLSAVIYCNSDGILNDDKYDYNTVGYPFFRNLGKIIYDEEVNRKRKIVPDLSGLKFVYDK